MLQSGPNATGQGVPVSLPMENQNPTRQSQVNGRAEIWDLESGIRDSGFGGPVSNEQEHK